MRERRLKGEGYRPRKCRGVGGGASGAVLRPGPRKWSGQHRSRLIRRFEGSGGDFITEAGRRDSANNVGCGSRGCKRTAGTSILACHRKLGDCQRCLTAGAHDTGHGIRKDKSLVDVAKVPGARKRHAACGLSTGCRKGRERRLNSDGYRPHSGKGIGGTAPALRPGYRKWPGQHCRGLGSEWLHTGKAPERDNVYRRPHPPKFEGHGTQLETDSGKPIL